MASKPNPRTPAPSNARVAASTPAVLTYPSGKVRNVTVSPVEGWRPTLRAKFTTTGETAGDFYYSANAGGWKCAGGDGDCFEIELA